MATTIEITLSGRQFEKMIESFSTSRADHFRIREAIMQHVLLEVSERQYQAFNDKAAKLADEFGRKWQELSPNTVAKKGHDTIGVETGRLRESFEPGGFAGGKYAASGPDQVASADAFSMQYGTSVEYAGYFDRGNTTNNPTARPLFPGTGMNYGGRTTYRHLPPWIVDGAKKGLREIGNLMRGRTG